MQTTTAADRALLRAVESPTIASLFVMRSLNRIWLHPGELKSIALELRARAPCNLLVFGVGNDSAFWNTMNLDGRTVFLEDSQEWLLRTRSRFGELDARHIVYDTRRGDWRRMLGTSGDHDLTLPGDVRESRWDVILVDGPRSNNDTAPGRMQSIAAAAFLAASNGSVFVHDCNRPLERAYCDYYLGDRRLVGKSWRLRHYRMDR